MNTCRRCQESIPDGRNYCAAHYMEAMAEYQAAREEYVHARSAWESMSFAEKAAANRSAEREEVGSFAALFGGLVGAVVWWLLELDALVGIILIVMTSAAVTAIQPIRILVGKLMRFVVYAILYFIGGWLLGWFISNWSPLIRDNASLFTAGLAVVAVVASALGEAYGGHHASAEPQPPSKPNP